MLEFCVPLLSVSAKYIGVLAASTWSHNRRLLAQSLCITLEYFLSKNLFTVLRRQDIRKRYGFSPLATILESLE